jgi:hypothetical protein
VYTAYAPAAIPDQVNYVRGLPVIHLSVHDRLTQQVNGVEYAPWSQAPFGEVVSAVVVGDEATS